MAAQLQQGVKNFDSPLRLIVPSASIPHPRAGELAALDVLLLAHCRARQTDIAALGNT